jgi:phosphopantetheinyl transferase
VEKAILLHAALAPGLPAPCAAGLLESLPYARRLQLEGSDAAARTASLAGVALALVAAHRLTGVPARVADLQLRDGQKPRFAAGPFFSISHSSDRVACVTCVGIDVGLDIETEPSAGGGSTRTLLQWTATEATLKAAATGLRRAGDVRVDLDGLVSDLDGRRYVLREVRPAPHALGHVAAAEHLDLDIEALALDGVAVSGALQRTLGLQTQG